MADESILIVGDNPANVKLASFNLASRGYDVRAAASAFQALESIRESVPRLVLVDLRLPTSTEGLELARRLRSNPETRGIVIVAITGLTMQGDHRRAVEACCDGYLTRAEDMQLLRTEVARYLALARPTPTPKPE